MYFTFGLREIFVAHSGLLKAHFPNDPVLDLNTIQTSLRRFIQLYSPKIPIPEEYGTQFIADLDTVKILSSAFKVTSILNDRNQSRSIVEENPQTKEELLAKSMRVKNAFQIFRERCPEVAEIFDNVIHSVFCAPSALAGGGSTSGAIGVIWCGYRQSWNDVDFMEFFVHELTHHLIFIDEYRYRHYKSHQEISDAENYTVSAILNIPRPLDKVLHSILVATEVLSFREEITGHSADFHLHPSSTTLLDKALRSAESIYARPELLDLLTLRGEFLLKTAQSKLNLLRTKTALKISLNNQFLDGKYVVQPKENFYSAPA